MLPGRKPAAIGRGLGVVPNGPAFGRSHLFTQRIPAALPPGSALKEEGGG